jgi:hypothetical protein
VGPGLGSGESESGSDAGTVPLVTTAAPEEASRHGKGDPSLPFPPLSFTLSLSKVFFSSSNLARRVWLLGLYVIVL